MADATTHAIESVAEVLYERDFYKEQYESLEEFVDELVEACGKLRKENATFRSQLGLPEFEFTMTKVISEKDWESKEDHA